LIEGNKGPDFDIIQRTSRAPIGNTRVGTLLAHHLRRAGIGGSLDARRDAESRTDGI
jgi:hypothetical protein